MAGENDRTALREALRADILAGRYLPRDRLIETDLATEYGYPRSVVRGALSDLVLDGLVEHERNRGARVRSVTIEEAIMVLQVRQRLQALCAELAAENGTPEEREQLPVLLDALRVAVEDNNVDELYDANYAIRQHIRAMSRQAVAGEMLERLEARNVLRFFPHAIPARRVDSYREQGVVLAAIQAGDARAAHDAELARIQHAIDTLRSLADSITAGGRLAAESALLL